MTIEEKTRENKMSKIIEKLAVAAGTRKTSIARIERSLVHLLMLPLTGKVLFHCAGISREILGI